MSVSVRWRLIPCFSVLSLCLAVDLASPDCPAGSVFENQKCIGTKKKIPFICESDSLKLKYITQFAWLHREPIFDSLLSISVCFMKTTMNVKAMKTILMSLGSVEKMQNA